MNTQTNGSQSRISDEERLLIKKVFKGNDPLLKLLRKLFLPEYDPTAPIGQVIDLWMTVDVKDKTPEDAYVTLLARNQLITHVEQQLVALKLMSEQVELTDEEVKQKNAKASSK